MAILGTDLWAGYTEENTMLVVRMQFYCIESARNLELFRLKLSPALLPEDEFVHSIEDAKAKFDSSSFLEQLLVCSMTPFGSFPVSRGFHLDPSFPHPQVDQSAFCPWCPLSCGSAPDQAGALPNRPPRLALALPPQCNPPPQSRLEGFL